MCISARIIRMAKENRQGNFDKTENEKPSAMKNHFKITLAIAVSMLASSFSSAQEANSGKQDPFAATVDEFEVKTFSATPRSNKVFINWTAVDLTGNCAYIVQRSADGTNYDNICIKKGAPSPCSTPILFSFVDEKPVSGNAYYRLKRISEAGATATDAIEVSNNNGPGRSANIALR